MKNNSIQPLVWDDDIIRFKSNEIVRFLLDSYAPGLNSIRIMPFSRDDYQQLMQLIGYSVDGYSSLSCASQRVLRKIDPKETKMINKRKGK
jgi:hypothetical protein